MYLEALRCFYQAVRSQTHEPLNLAKKDDGTMATSLPPLIQQMLQPRFYPHSVLEPIKLLQTHISYILLTGEYAYKVKKSVKLNFLDFSTLDQRHHFCQEELRLNRRLAPELYLSVLPIIENSSGQFQMSSTTPPIVQVIEYAVQMRQFEKDGLQLFNENQLTFAHMQSLGKRIARFHQQAKTNTNIQNYGSVDAIRQIDSNNFQLSQSFIHQTQTQSQSQQTYDFNHQFLTNHPDWFAQRQVNGKIRECHGDLHLRNLCLFQDQLQVFDCIEFNQEFRYIDVLYDIAFLVMDLDFHGRPDLANEFLNTYLEQTGDYGGGILLPLYLIMRAYIRGNVISLSLNDPSISPTDKPALQQQAKAYYNLAYRYTHRPQGQILLMSGLSGSGKSTVARQLARRINAIVIRSDAVRKHLAGIHLYQKGSGQGDAKDIYTPEMTQKTYATLLELGLCLVQQGWSVILDAKYDRQALRQEVITQAKFAQIPLRIVACTAPVDVIRNRLLHRNNDISDATIALLEAQRQQTEDFTDIEQPYVVPINTNQDLNSQLMALIGV